MEALRPQLASAVAKRVPALPVKPDQVCLIVHIPVAGVGFAMSARNDLHLESELELCVCSRRSSAPVYAHELLHLFGAPDLYFNPWLVLTQRGETEESSRLIELLFASSGCERFSAYFGNSIMGNTSLGIGRLTIDPITARSIGWRKPDGPFLKAMGQMDQALAEAAADALPGGS